MKLVLVDTDILSLFFREHRNVVTCFREYLQGHRQINLSIITYYEIVSGLRHRDARKQLHSFLEFAQRNAVLPLTEHSVTISAEHYASLRSKGQPVDDIDLLIAGVALTNNLVLATRNRKHFGRIEGLEIVDWSE